MKTVKQGVVLFGLLMIILPVWACAQQVDMPDQTVYQGQELVVPIRFTDFDSTGSQAFRIQMQYDTSVVAGVEFEKPVGSSWMFAANVSHDTITIAGVTGADTLSGAGTLANLHLIISVNAPSGASTVRFTQVEFYPVDYQESHALLPVGARSATFQVETWMAGDVNYDNAVTLEDVQLVLRKVVGDQTGLVWDLRRIAAADLDTNNQIEAYDGELIWQRTQ